MNRGSPLQIIILGWIALIFQWSSILLYFKFDYIKFNLLSQCFFILAVTCFIISIIKLYNIRKKEVKNE